MKITNCFLALAAISLFACQGPVPAGPTPYVYKMADAKINLGHSANAGPLGCVELNEDGTFVAEVLTEGLEGLEKYIALPFDRIMAGVKDTRSTVYRYGTYRVEEDAYELEGVGRISFEEDMMFARYTFEGVSYRDRTGVTEIPVTSPVPTAGTWVVRSVETKVGNLATRTWTEGQYDSLDFEKMALDAAAGAVPGLSDYLDLFKGYKLVRLRGTRLGSYVLEFANGVNLGGSWKLDRRSRTVSAVLRDEHKMKLTLHCSARVEENRFILDLTGEVEVEGNPAYELSVMVLLI